MNNPSPGPGWWMASDGNWYPQKWEYMCRNAHAASVEELWRQANSLGQEGWELVNVLTYGGGGGQGQAASFAWFKRPIRP
jgi:hypothetical protein